MLGCEAQFYSGSAPRAFYISVIQRNNSSSYQLWLINTKSVIILVRGKKQNQTSKKKKKSLYASKELLE